MTVSALKSVLDGGDQKEKEEVLPQQFPLREYTGLNENKRGVWGGEIEEGPDSGTSEPLEPECSWRMSSWRQQEFLKIYSLL